MGRTTTTTLRAVTVAVAVFAAATALSSAGSSAAAPAPQVRVPTSLARAPASLPRNPAPHAATAPAPAAGSGKGRRIVFDIGEQRVWLLTNRDRVRRSYLVSGSLTDNLAPGSYRVYSKSRRAWGIDDSGTMRYMVRFAHGRRAAIGFHDIPVDDGKRVQSRAELGTPQSHGCIRQRRADARALWRFAPLGTRVVVVR